MGVYESLKKIWKKLGLKGQVKNFSSAEIYDDKKSLRVSVLAKTAVEENHFGKPAYRDEVWGSPIQLVTDVSLT